VAELQKQTQESRSNLQDLLTIITLIDKDKISEFYGILLNETNLWYLEENLDLETGTEILAIVCENNDILKIKKNIQRITLAIQKQTKMV
jgi:hypothetical protein